MRVSGSLVRVGILLMLLPFLRADDDLLTLPTPSGNITGIGVNVAGLPGTKTYQFRKIPFAKPPIGDLRFAKPEPYGAWNDTLNATVFGPSCMQLLTTSSRAFLPNTDISEDCLFLNIYLPNGYDQSKNKSVMVWIHGGGYQYGAGMYYDPAYMAVKGDVIVVTINYRLNAFGFLTLRNDIVKGNYGIWDQIFALRWVQNNILAFGGDSGSVAIFGESAGGFSVGLLSLIPSNQGLFHRVIAQSGVGNSFFTMARRGVAITKEIGKMVNCDTSNPSAFLACLRGKSSLEVLNVSNTASLFTPTPLHITTGLAPVVDNELFADLPEKLLRDKTSAASKFFRSLDFIVGNVNSEGSLIVSLLYSLQAPSHFNATEGLPYDVFCGEVIRSITGDYFKNVTKVHTAICSEYGERGNMTGQAQQSVEMFTDLFFISPGISTLRYHAESNSNARRYQYIFTKVPAPYSFAQYPNWFRGARHADELFFLFGLRDLVKLNITLTQDDLRLSDTMVTYWTNFAKTGDPNVKNPGGAIITTWPRFSGATESYIVLDKVITTGSKYKDKRMNLWLKDIPKLLSAGNTSSEGSKLNLPNFLFFVVQLLFHCALMRY